MTETLETTEPVQPPPPPEGPASPWAIRDFRLLWVGRVAAVLGIQIQSSALLWQVYEIARRDHPIQEASLYLGLVGLCQFLPLLALTLPAGALADRRDRKNTVTLSVMVETRPGLAPESIEARSAAERLRHEVKVFVGSSVEVVLKPEGGVERSQGKAKRVVDLRPK